VDVLDLDDVKLMWDCNVESVTEEGEELDLRGKEFP